MPDSLNVSTLSVQSTPAQSTERAPHRAALIYARRAAAIGALSLYFSVQAQEQMGPIPHFVSPVEIALGQIEADPNTTRNAQESLGFLLGFVGAYGAMGFFIRRHYLGLRA